MRREKSSFLLEIDAQKFTLKETNGKRTKSSVLLVFGNIDLKHPFSLVTANQITKISYVALTIGLIALAANEYSKWLMEKEIVIQLTWGGSEFLFVVGIILVITLLLKRGIEIQPENYLTI